MDGGNGSSFTLALFETAHRPSMWPPVPLFSAREAIPAQAISSSSERETETEAEGEGEQDLAVSIGGIEEYESSYKH